MLKYETVKQRNGKWKTENGKFQLIIFYSPLCILHRLSLYTMRLYFIILFNFMQKLITKPFEIAKFDSLPNLSHRVKKERQIVMRNQNCRQHFLRLIKMSDVAA